jgi:hypothetical protein
MKKYEDAVIALTVMPGWVFFISKSTASASATSNTSSMEMGNMNGRRNISTMIASMMVCSSTLVMMVTVTYIHQKII